MFFCGAGLACNRRRSRACAAVDLTFSTPKSVSVLSAIADDAVSAALLAAHKKAVEEAFAYVEREACFTHLSLRKPASELSLVRFRFAHRRGDAAVPRGRRGG